jgi:hypothetical protein
LSATSRIYSWKGSFLDAGSYTVRVTANTPSNYYKRSDIAVSDKTPFVSLFTTSSPSSGSYGIIDTTYGSITGYYGSIYLSGISKPGVAYSVERAPADSVGNVAGVYAAVTPLSRVSGTQESLGSGDLTADILGNLPVSTVYDRSLKDGENYKYRVVATKEGRTQTREASNFVTIDSREYFRTSISFSNPTNGLAADGTTVISRKYTVSISYAIRGALKEGDALVVYYVKGNGISAQSGPYGELVKFTVGDLEKTSGGYPAIEPKDVAISKLTTGSSPDNAAYVQVYIEYADGRPRENITNNYLQTGGGVSSKSSYGSPSVWYGALAY